MEIRLDHTIASANATAPATREIGLDLIRIFATLLVITVHVAAVTWSSFGQNWAADNFYDSLARICVPLFFMVSGALIIPKEDSLAKLADRLLKIAIPLAFWSLVYAIWLAPATNDISVVTKALRQIVIGPPTYGHLWFLYSLLGLYLFMPVLQALFRDGRRYVTHGFLAVTFVGASLLPTLSNLSGIPWRGVDLGYFPIYAGYALAGAVLRSFSVSNLTAGVLIACSFAFGLMTFAGTHFLSVAKGGPAQNLYAYNAPFVVASTLAAFIALRGLKIVSVTGQNLVQLVSDQCFGIYLVHILVLYYVNRDLINVDFTTHWVSVPVVSLAVFLLSGLLVAVLRRWPGTRRILP